MVNYHSDNERGNRLLPLHGLCYTSCGSLAETWNRSLGSPRGAELTIHRSTGLHPAPYIINWSFYYQYHHHHHYHHQHYCSCRCYILINLHTYLLGLTYILSDLFTSWQPYRIQDPKNTPELIYIYIAYIYICYRTMYECLCGSLCVYVREREKYSVCVSVSKVFNWIFYFYY